MLTVKNWCSGKWRPTRNTQKFGNGNTYQKLMRVSRGEKLISSPEIAEGNFVYSVVFVLKWPLRRC